MAAHAHITSTGPRRTTGRVAAAAAGPQASALVLAGGRSSRFGVDKLGVYVGGQPLLGYALAAVAHTCREVVVVAAPDVSAGDRQGDGVWPAATLGIPVRIVHDDEAFGGPLLGVIAGLRAARHPLCVVVGGDMPLLRPALLAHLLAVADADRTIPPRSVALRLDGTVQPLPLVLRRDALTAIAGLARDGRRSLRDLLVAMPFRVLEPEEWLPYDPDGTSFVDVDRIEDLVRWSERLAGPVQREVGR